MNNGIAYLTELVNIKITKILQKNVEKLWTLCIAFSVLPIDTLLNKIFLLRTAQKPLSLVAQLAKWPLIPHMWGFFAIIKESKEFLIMDPRFEEEALAALMEEAFSQTTEETKFDVDAYFASDIDY